VSVEILQLSNLYKAFYDQLFSATRLACLNPSDRVFRHRELFLKVSRLICKIKKREEACEFGVGEVQF
jgi:hypothetical protein